MTEAERLAEIELLVEDQQKDDVYQIEHEYMGRFRALSLDTGENDGSWLAVDIHGERIPPNELNPHPRRGMFRGGGLAAIPHGTYNGYHNYGCRCEPCTQAATAYLVPRMARRRKQEQDARPEIECACGCGEMLKPIPSNKRFVNYQHADRSSKRRARERWSEEKKRADYLRLKAIPELRVGGHR